MDLEGGFSLAGDIENDKPIGGDRRQLPHKGLSLSVSPASQLSWVHDC